MAPQSVMPVRHATAEGHAFDAHLCSPRTSQVQWVMSSPPFLPSSLFPPFPCFPSLPRSLPEFWDGTFGGIIDKGAIDAIHWIIPFPPFLPSPRFPPLPPPRLFLGVFPSSQMAPLAASLTRAPLMPSFAASSQQPTQQRHSQSAAGAVELLALHCRLLGVPGCLLHWCPCYFGLVVCLCCFAKAAWRP